MDELEQQIIAILMQARDEMRANMQAQNINASGRTSASMRVEKYAGGVRLVGGTDGMHSISDAPSGINAANTAPIPTLEFGRAGGGNPPVPRGFYYIIREWTREKGLSFASESERGTFAYFLARKIAREGTKRHQIPADVYSTPVMNARERIEIAIKSSLRNTISAALSGATVTNIEGAFTT